MSCLLRNRRIREQYVRWCERSENKEGGKLLYFPPNRFNHVTGHAMACPYVVQERIVVSYHGMTLRTTYRTIR